MFSLHPCVPGVVRFILPPQADRSSQTGSRMNRLRWFWLRIRDLDSGRRILIVQTFCLLLAARIALRWLPSRHILASLERRRGHLLAHSTRAPRDPTLYASVHHVRWAVLAVSRSSPIRFVCFPQCLAASWLLARRGIPSTLHYGAARLEGRLAAHTWLEAGGSIVIGGEAASEFSHLRSF